MRSMGTGNESGVGGEGDHEFTEALQRVGKGEQDG